MGMVIATRMLRVSGSNGVLGQVATAPLAQYVLAYVYNMQHQCLFFFYPTIIDFTCA